MKKILNLGCGSILMRNAVNIDLILPKNIPEDIEFVQSGIIEYLTDLPYDVQFEKVRMFNVLEHLTQEEAEILPHLLNAHMVMRGEVIGTIPDFREICIYFLSDGITFRRAYFDTVADGEHKSIWIKEELERIFHTDGFKVVEYEIGEQGVNAFFRIEKVIQTTTPVDLMKEMENNEQT